MCVRLVLIRDIVVKLGLSLNHNKKNVIHKLSVKDGQRKEKAEAQKQLCCESDQKR